jgi:hypothetical protein
MKILVAALIALSISPMASAENLSFASCDIGPNKVTDLNCRISLINEYLKNAFGGKAVKVANKLVEQECQAVSGSVRLPPELRLLAAMDCEFRVKLDYYQELAR